MGTINETIHIFGEINKKELEIKEYKDKRVVTFKEINEVHERATGTARRNFKTNNIHFIEGVEYFV